MAEHKTNAMRQLERSTIPYKLHTYEPGDKIDGISVAEKLSQPLEQVYKTLVTKGKSGGYFVFLLPVAQELDLKKAAKAAGEKSVAMIPVREINRVTGYIRGGCSPLGMKKQFPTFIENHARQLSSIIVSGGRIGYQMELDPGDLARAAQATFADLLL